MKSSKKRLIALFISIITVVGLISACIVPALLAVGGGDALINEILDAGGGNYAYLLSDEPEPPPEQKLTPTPVKSDNTKTANNHGTVILFASYIGLTIVGGIYIYYRMTKE